MLHSSQRLEQLHKGTGCQLITGVEFQHLQFYRMFGETRKRLVADSWTIVEIDNLKVIQIFSNERDAFLCDLAPLDLQSLQFTLSHGHEANGIIADVVAVISLKKRYSALVIPTVVIARRGKRGIRW